MTDEIEVNYKYISFAILIIAVLLIGLYIGGIKPKKENNEFMTLFPACANYCNALNETGYIRHELSDNHYKCFCYSDDLKRMEEK